MKKDSKKTIMIIALVSILICGCPGCVLLINGIANFETAAGNIQNSEDIWEVLAASLIQGGWMVCVSALLILVPFVLVIFAVVKRSQKEDLENLEPTGVSKEDPLPPTS